jgi:hypothetical protein
MDAKAAARETLRTEKNAGHWVSPEGDDDGGVEEGDKA